MQSIAEKMHLSIGAHHKNLNEDRPILSAAKLVPSDSSIWHGIEHRVIDVSIDKRRAQHKASISADRGYNDHTL